MKTFLPESSIVKKIWGTTDIALFIFAGASAEFALNKQVDWLYFTGRLPADPIGRLFSTIRYAHEIIFSEEKKALDAIERINSIHHGVESARGKKISAEGYQDVLYMLIHYSIASFELLERKLTDREKNEIVNTFNRIGNKMNIPVQADSYDKWLTVYFSHLETNLSNSSFTKHLFTQYRKSLGPLRYFLLIEIQSVLVSAQVNRLLGLRKPSLIRKILPVYRSIRKFGIHRLLITAMVPGKFRHQIKMMNRAMDTIPHSIREN